MDRLPRAERYEFLDRSRLEKHKEALATLDAKLVEANERDTASRRYFNALISGDAAGAGGDILQIYRDLPQSKTTPVDTHFLVDVSGSMSLTLRSGKTRLQAAVDGIKYILQDVLDANRRDRVALTTFSHETQDILPNQPVPPSKEWLLRTVDSLRATGGTRLYEAFSQTLQTVLANVHSGTTQFLFVFTDGAVSPFVVPCS